MYGIAVADLDGDGEKDVAVHNGLKREVVGLKGNSGAFREIMRLPVGYWGSAIAAGDVDGDGRADLVAGGMWVQEEGPWVGRDVAVLKADGRGGFLEPEFYAARPERLRGYGNNATGEVKVADVDGDGNLDLLVTTGSTVSLLRGLGEGEFDFAQVLVADEKVEYTDVVVLATGEIAIVGNESLQGVRPVVKVLRVEGKSVSVQGTMYPAGRNGATVGSLAAGDVKWRWPGRFGRELCGTGRCGPVWQRARLWVCLRGLCIRCRIWNNRCEPGEPLGG